MFTAIGFGSGSIEKLAENVLGGGYEARDPAHDEVPAIIYKICYEREIVLASRGLDYVPDGYAEVREREHQDDNQDYEADHYVKYILGP